MAKTVDTIRHKTIGVETPLKMEKQSAHEIEFFADYGGVTYRDTSAQKVATQVLAAMEASIHVTWTPVIEVTRAGSGWTYDASSLTVGFTLSRYYAAKVAGSMRQVHWGIDFTDHECVASNLHETRPGLRSVNGTLQLPSTDALPGDRHRTPTRFFLAYTEELWQALSALQERIKQLRDILDRLLQSESGLAYITQSFSPEALASGAVIPLLPPGEGS